MLNMVVYLPTRFFKLPVLKSTPLNCCTSRILFSEAAITGNNLVASQMTRAGLWAKREIKFNSRSG